MTPIEISAKISEVSDIISTRKHRLKLTKQGFTFIVQTAKEQESNPDRSRADSAKIRLAEAYIEMSQQEFELENLQDKLKTFTKALRTARA